MKYDVSIGYVSYHQKILSVDADSETDAHNKIMDMMNNNTDDINVWCWDNQTDSHTKITIFREVDEEVSGETCNNCDADLVGVKDGQITAICPVCGRTTAVCCNCTDHMDGNADCCHCPYASVIGNTYL